MERLRSASVDPGICSKCGHENLYYSVRCTRCGALLDVVPSGASGAPLRSTHLGGAHPGGFDRVIGKGAFSTVYGLWTGSEALAVKVFGRADRATRSHLDRELAALTRIEHAGVARLVGAGHVGASPYLAMPLYEGPTLRAILDGLARRSRRLDLETAIEIARGIAAALEAIHAQGFVHRDLKPENVIVTTDGPVVIDFGFAHPLREAERRARPDALESRATRIAGTLPHIAPEHLAGARPDAPADLFALGGVLFEMLAGRAPFGDEQIIRAILEGRPGELPRDVPDELADLTLALLDREPSARPRTAARWLRDLAQSAELTPPLRPRRAASSRWSGAPSSLRRYARTSRTPP